MTTQFLPDLPKCCFCCSILIGSIFTFLVDVFRAVYLTFDYYHPLCYNVQHTSGIALYAGYISFFSMVTAIGCVFYALMILLTKVYVHCVNDFDYCIDWCVAGNMYTAFTMANILFVISFYSIYLSLVSKAGKVCVCGYKLSGMKAVPKFESKGMSIPGMVLGIFIFDAVFRMYLAAVINSLEELNNDYLSPDYDDED